jgi:hypothetical protein
MSALVSIIYPIADATAKESIGNQGILL